ncbi:MAG: universal stress protein [Sphingobacteriaceae bacterium]|nr:MAG: universal stress protein [Sphingobacteriaceae bacterium]
MKTYLIPTDFSSSSVAAIHYAAHLSTQTGVSKLILLHAYHVSTLESILPSTEFVQMVPQDIAENSRLKMLELQDIKSEISGIVNEGVEIELQLVRLPLLRAILEIQENNPVDLLVLCSKYPQEDMQVGRNIVEISKISPAPVLVVPGKAVAVPLKKLVLACDFKKVTETIPLEKLNKVWEVLQAELLVVNVDQKGLHQQKDPKMLAQESALYQMLKPYQPQYFFIDHADTIRGIVDFAVDNEAQIIIALPRKYSFFESFLPSNITAELTIKSSLPVLLLK